MSMRTLLFLILTTPLVIFTALNWSAFTAPTTLWLLVDRVQAPLGLVMLAVTGLYAVLFIAYLASLRTAALLESRSHARELQLQRQLAEQSESSRLKVLHGVVEAGFRQLEERVAQAQSAVQVRVDQIAVELHATVEQTGTVLSAYIGEVEDRLEQRISMGGAAPAP